jgi:Fic family protein
LLRCCFAASMGAYSSSMIETNSTDKRQLFLSKSQEDEGAMPRNLNT